MSAMPAASVLLVMKRSGNVRIMQQALAQLGYSGTGISSEADLQSALTEPLPPRLAVVDVTGFGACVWKMCGSLQSHRIPFIVLSTPRESMLSERSLSCGAASVLQKPVAKSALLELVHSLAG